MSLTLDRTQQTFVQAMQAEDTGGQTLHRVVARLLAIALMAMDWRESQDQPGFLPTPERYRTWPVVKSQSSSCGRLQQHRFYVCPPAAILSDNQPFPVGTAFVVETTQIEAMNEPLVSQFVMKQYAVVTTGKVGRLPYGAWASAVYGQASVVLPVGETSYASDGDRSHETPVGHETLRIVDTVHFQGQVKEGA